MANFNRVILAGNLTRDPQLSSLPSGMAVCELGMAINDKWRDKNTNEMRERTCFVDLRAYGRQAETLNQYMSKGKPIMIEGKLRFDQWEAKDGSGKRSKLYVIVDTFQFLGAPGGQRSDDRGGAAPNEMPPLDTGDAGGDNIPF